MKSYFLSGIEDEGSARAALSELFPGQTEPWNLLHQYGDTIAYFNIQLEDETLEIQADISGRHHNEDAKVIHVLRKLQETLGGVILDDFENTI
jgi:hypothetical protein